MIIDTLKGDYIMGMSINQNRTSNIASHIDKQVKPPEQNTVEVLVNKYLDNPGQKAEEFFTQPELTILMRNKVAVKILGLTPTETKHTAPPTSPPLTIQITQITPQTSNDEAIAKALQAEEVALFFAQNIPSTDTPTTLIETIRATLRDSIETLGQRKPEDTVITGFFVNLETINVQEQKDILAGIQASLPTTPTETIIHSLPNGYCGPNSILLSLARLPEKDLEKIPDSKLVAFVKENKGNPQKLQLDGVSHLQRIAKKHPQWATAQELQGSKPSDAPLFWASTQDLFLLAQELKVNLNLHISGTEDSYNATEKETTLPTIHLSAPKKVGHYDAFILPPHVQPLQGR